MPHSASEIFVSRLSPEHRHSSAVAGDLDAVLKQVLRRARLAWPSVSLTDDEYLTYLAQRTPVTPQLPQALDEVCVEDLYLACGCARGDPEALRMFDDTFTPDIRNAVSRLVSSRMSADDVRQTVHVRLFVTNNGHTAKIAGFSGRGTLKSWVCAAAIRTALNLRRKHSREITLAQQSLSAFADVSDDPELGYLKEAYRDEFKRAFREALASLTRRQRNLLRHQVLDRMSIDQVGLLYRVHRATAARWIRSARQTLLKTTKKNLTKRLGISDQELDSVLALVESRLYQSLSGFLRETEH